MQGALKRWLREKGGQHLSSTLIGFVREAPVRADEADTLIG